MMVDRSYPPLATPQLIVWEADTYTQPAIALQPYFSDKQA